MLRGQPAVRDRGPWRTAALGALAAAAILALVTIAATRLTRPTTTETRYTIPPGTAARIERGEYIEIIPLNVSMQAGDRMTVINQDDRQHVVGPFSVRAGETITYQFSQPGTFRGECTVHARKQVVITVT